MKYIKTYEDVFEIPTEEELKDYDIRKGDYVIANDKYSSLGPYFLDDLVENEIGKVNKIFISNKGYRNEEIYCEIWYYNVPEHIAKHISNKPFIYKHSVQINQLRKITPEELEQYNIKQATNKYNL